MPSSSVEIEHFLEMFMQISPESVFSHSAPFFDAYRIGYLDALVKQDCKVLDVHREAIFYLSPDWEFEVILALILIASQNPDANFVESLAFYFSLEDKMMKFRMNAIERRPNMQPLLRYSLSKLRRRLGQTMDKDMADVFYKLQNLIDLH